MSLSIEKGVPIPAEHGKQLGLAYTVNQMEIGDAVFLEGRKSFSPRQRISLEQAAGVRLIYRKVESGIRIWRTE